MLARLPAQHAPAAFARLRRKVALLITAFLLASGGRALAAVPLRTLPVEASLRLERLAGRGELALIESRPDGTLRQITIYTVVDAPVDKVEYVVAHPKEYPDFVPNVVKSDIVGSTGEGGLFYEWELDVPLVNLKGTSKVSFEPAPRTGAAPSVHIETVRGDVPNGTWEWQFLPASGGRTLLAYHGYADVRHSSWFLKKLIQHNKTIEHGALLASGIVFVKAVKLRAEAIAGHGTGQRPRIDLTVDRNVAINGIKGTFDAGVLAPLLDRGQVALVESFHDGRLRQANLLSYVYAPEPQMYQVVTTPADFAKFVPGLKRCSVQSDDGREAVYELEIKVPVLPNIEYKSRMRREPETQSVRIAAISGDARGSVYGWDLAAVSPRQTLAIYQLNGQLRKQSWLFKKMIESEPFFEHGVNVSVALATMMAMRGRAEGWR
jgi:ribosome-associated toxin RatA of RatAB toxin-antitoxin module